MPQTDCLAPATPDPATARLGLMAAMPEELHALLDHVQGRQTVQRAGRHFHTGTWHGLPVVAVLSGIGKVAAAVTSTVLHSHFGVTELVFTGVAGGVGPDVAIGDLVLGESFVQHDMDASPLFPRFELPGTGRTVLPADGALTDSLAAALAPVQGCPVWQAVQASGLVRPQGSVLHRGMILSGDQFVGHESRVAALRADWPRALAVEMEGAAVAQVCLDLGLPFAVMRAISDRADSAAHVDFAAFLARVASPMAAAWLDAWLRAKAQRAEPPTAFGHDRH